MSRARRIFASLAVVLVSYWAYLLVAVPLIEPPAKGAVDMGPTPIVPKNGDVSRDLAKLFPADSWQAQNPAILENGKSILLFRRYRNTGDGRVEIHPCTVIYTPPGPVVDEAQRLRQKVILDAPDGAILQFDKPVEFGHGELGHLVAGQLIGNVIIRSEGKSPGPEDDLWLATQNVYFSERLVWTTADVEFRYGPSRGRGRDMKIGLSEPDETQRGRRGGVAMGDLETLELRHVEQLHLEPAKGKPAGGNPPGMAGLTGSGSQQDLPVEVTCRGPFRLDLPHRTATFREHVDVLRLHADGPSDDLSCELLTIFLEPKRDLAQRKPPTNPTEKPAKVGLLDLEAQRMEAVGEPVTISAPADKVQAQGDKLIYNVWTGRINLQGRDDVWLKQDNNEIHSLSLQYDPAADGRLGLVDADGPGRFRGQMVQHPPQRPQPMEGHWSDYLRIRPQAQNQVVSLHGNVELRMPGMGQLNAQEVHFWLLEQPPSAGQAAQAGPPGQHFQPDRMMAEKDVVLNSPQMSAQVDHMEVWFTQAAAPAGPAATVIRHFEAPERPAVPAAATPAPTPTGAPTGQNRSRAELQPTVLRLSYEEPPGFAAASDGHEQPARPANQPGDNPNPGPQDPGANSPGSPASPPPPPPAASPPPPAGPAAAPAGAPVPPAGVPPQQHFEVQGRVLRVQMMLHAQQQAEVSNLIVQDNVRFTETQTTQPDEKPVVIVGDRIEAVNPSQGAGGVVTVLGRPARFDGRGLTLTGANLNLDRGANRIWVDGPGTMALPMDHMPEMLPTGPLAADHPPAEPPRKVLAPAAGPPATLDIRWHQGMEFDGRLAKFRNQVTAIAPLRQMHTEYLEVQLKKPIQFSQANQTATQPAGELERITCRGGVWMEAITLEGQEPTAKQQAEMVNFTLNLLTGAAEGNGPGWLVYISKKGADQPGSPGSFLPGGARLPGAAPGRSRAAPAGTPPPDDGMLSCLYVRFQGKVTGNIQLREATFHDWVKTAYGPVNTWDAKLDPDRPELLGPRGMTMVCDQLSVLDMPTPLEGRWAFEMTAAGNVVLDSVLYTARSDRLSYSQAKDLLILEGDGRTEARLWRHLQLNSNQNEEVKAQRIDYWPSTNRTVLSGFRGGQMQGAGN
jgi:hypothetical protein